MMTFFEAVAVRLEFLKYGKSPERQPEAVETIKKGRKEISLRIETNEKDSDALRP